MNKLFFKMFFISGAVIGGLILLLDVAVSTISYKLEQKGAKRK